MIYGQGRPVEAGDITITSFDGYTNAIHERCRKTEENLGFARFCDYVAEAERAACATIAETMASQVEAGSAAAEMATHIAECIRARPRKVPKD